MEIFAFSSSHYDVIKMGVNESDLIPTIINDWDYYFKRSPEKVIRNLKYP